jgi:hypothetical protein
MKKVGTMGINNIKFKDQIDSKKFKLQIGHKKLMSKVERMDHEFQFLH